MMKQTGGMPEVLKSLNGSGGFSKRGVHIVKANIEAAVKEHWLDEDGASHVNYQTHTAYLCKDGDDMYMEEHMEDRNALCMIRWSLKTPRPCVRPHSLILSLKRR
ncbi:hypothetical protein PO124_29175 [Bacillus licheniformis]|nr:hypothetical protein [Bacillus licheniformis]